MSGGFTWKGMHVTTTPTPPPGYLPLGTLDLSNDRRLQLGLLGAALLLLPVVAWLLWQLTAWLRPDLLQAWSTPPLVVRPPGGGFGLNLRTDWLGGLLAALLLTMPLHELVHAACFYRFTRRRPVFGLSLLYAYVAAPPGVYVARDPYMVIALAPLVVLGLLGLALLLVVPPLVAPAVLGVLLFNTVGAVGDLLVSAWLLRHPPTVLAQDVGDRMTLYGPA